MELNPNLYRNRAVLALHRLIGGPATTFIAGPGVPVSLDLPEAGLVLTAGDNKEALDLTQLRPLAIERRRDVLGTYVDPMLSGHRFVFDIVLYRRREAKLHTEYRLWLADSGAAWLVPERGEGRALALTNRGLRTERRQPYRDAVERQLGIARGQARLHDLVYAGTPYASPLDRAVGR